MTSHAKPGSWILGLKHDDDAPFPADDDWRTLWGNIVHDEPILHDKHFVTAVPCQWGKSRRSLRQRIRDYHASEADW